jgi:hypothetical protein
MKTFLLLITLTFCHIISGQDRKTDRIIPNNEIRPWVANQISDYKGNYHFSNSELESSLILNINNDSCFAQIKSGEFVKKGDKTVRINHSEPVRNIKIKGNKFFSEKTNGEFVIFKVDHKEIKGLMVYKPWSSWLHYTNDKGYELGYKVEL